MRITILHLLTIMFLFLASPVRASDRLELDTTIIKGNKESPAILYIVPWKETRTHNDEYQGLALDNLQEDILVPEFPSRELLFK